MKKEIVIVLKRELERQKSLLKQKNSKRIFHEARLRETIDLEKARLKRFTESKQNYEKAIENGLNYEEDINDTISEISKMIEPYLVAEEL